MATQLAYKGHLLFDPKVPMFTGTQAQWEALTIEEKREYDVVVLTDDDNNSGFMLTNSIEEGNYNAPTSDAVAKAVTTVEQDWAISGIEQNGDSATSLNANSWYKTIGRMAMGEVVLTVGTDIGPSTTIAIGLPPAYDVNGYGQHWSVRAQINGNPTTIPVYINNKGELHLSGNSPNLTNGDTITFNQTYLTVEND